MRPDRFTAVNGMSVQFRQPEGRSFFQQGRQYLCRPGVNEKRAWRSEAGGPTPAAGSEGLT